MQHRFRKLVQELKNRGVFRSLVGYSVVSWMLLQVADVTFDRLPIPDNSMTIAIVLVVIGFPITAVLAWAFEFTSSGIVPHAATDGGAPRLFFIHYLLIVLAVSAGSAGLLYYVSQNYWESPRHSIAVLPFTNANDESDTEYFSDGLTEEIRSLIVRLNEFRVVALSTSYQLKDSVEDVASVANRLGAEVVLQGSVRRYKNRVAVTARLIDGERGNELWSDTYEREMSDIYGIQDDIARQVARALHVVLPVRADRRLRNLGTRNVDAYDNYLRGIDYLRKPPDETTLLIAEGFLKESLALDPNFANAHAAMCRRELASYRLSADPEQFGDAERVCLAALQLHADSAEMHLALGGLYGASGKLENALDEYERALAVNPNLPDAYIGLAKTYIAMHRDDDAEANLRRAIDVDVSYWASFNELGKFLFSQGRFLEAAEFFQMFVNRADDDAQALNNLGGAYYFAGDFKRAAAAWDDSLVVKPTRSAYSNTGSMYFYLGDFEQAADRYAKAVNLAPNDYRLWGNLADAYYFMDGKSQVSDVAYKRAVEFGEKQLEIDARNTSAMSDVALFYSRLGQHDKALEMDAESRRQAPDDMYVYYNSALIYAQFEQTDEALTMLERAVELEYQKELLPLDPAFEALRDEQRFKNLVAKRSQ